jgi:hypothetical protein
MKKTLLATLIFGATFCSLSKLNAQCSNGRNALGQPCGGAIQTAVSFLRIAPDARSGAMGDAGIAITPDANSINYNASKLVFAEQKFGVSATYTPWLSSLGLGDIYLGYLAGYVQLPSSKDQKQAIGWGLKYFSLGKIDWTDEQGNVLNQGNPREFQASVSYSRQLSKGFSMGITANYIYSNLATGLNVGGQNITSGTAAAADLSMTYKTKINMSGKKTDFTIGAAVTNLGSKITYARLPDFLPTTAGLGLAWEIPLDQSNTLTITSDFTKLLVPTPDSLGTWRTLSPIGGAINSLFTAPGGFGEKLKEINISFGVEYWYDKQFALRLGIFNEDKEKGNRKYITAGLGLKYNVVGINLSYLVPTSSVKNPLDNTLRFSLLFDMASFKQEAATDGN